MMDILTSKTIGPLPLKFYNNSKLTYQSYTFLYVRIFSIT